MLSLAVTTLALGSAGTAAAAPSGAEVYLAQLEGAPLSTYTGGAGGIPATRPAPGGKLDPQSWNFNAYRDRLRAQRRNVLRTAGIDAGRAVAVYETVVNGVAVKLTEAEANRMRSAPGVIKLWKNSVYTIDTISTPEFLGLTGPGGVWQSRFGDPAHAGEGVIVGVIDTGVWPESPSFAPLPEPRPDADTIAAKWQGECQPGEPTVGEDPVACNNKLIGARWYDFGSVPIVDEEFNSPRDFDGHGSHTASTAVGNHDVPAVIDNVEVGRASGMAPAARLAAYKVCYELSDHTNASCGALETVAAIDDAVADGVDVINFSVGGSQDSIVGLTDLAFLHAAAAGVFVATSAGNNGPDAGTVAHNGPWTTTVAASTHDRSWQKSATLGDGATYSGPGLGPAVPSSSLIDSAGAGTAAADPAEAELCFVGTLDPAKVTGKIVLCRRGTNARVDKSRAVKEAGGVGMILYNPTPNSLNADVHVVPTVHVGPSEGASIKAYIAGTANPTAALSAATKITVRAPEMAAFSSAGPAQAGGGDLLKPDVTAPGVDVVAAVSPANHSGNLYDASSGTSMSSPHIAGIGALLKAKNPTWSPMAIKSAIMTTASTVDTIGAVIQRAGAPATPLSYGAGHVRPAAAFDPGLVYESTPAEWVQYACGIGQTPPLGEGGTVCDLIDAIDPSDLNYPSIAVGDLPGRQTVKRTVTNATNRTSVYFAQVQAPAGFTVKVTPTVLTVRPRQSASFTVDIVRTSATRGAWSFGALTWSDLRGHVVRSPLAVRAADISAPVEINAHGVSGSVPLTVRAGHSGLLTARPFGLVPSAITTRHLVGEEKGFDAENPAENPAVAKVSVTVPDGSRLGRFATFDSDYPPGTDLDLFVYKDSASIGVSAGSSAEERITVTEPGTYDVYLVQYSLAAELTEQDVRLHSFIVGATATGNLTASPAIQRVTLGRPVTVTAAWSSLTAGERYLGVIEYGNGSAALRQTILSVEA